VLQPWASAIASGKKQVENRGWAPPKWLVGQDLVIHAGKKPMDEEDAREVFGFLFPEFEDADFLKHPAAWTAFKKWVESMPMGAVVAVVRVRGTMHSRLATEHGQDDWHMGELFNNHAWWLENLRLPAMPIPCRGKQGLWDLPADVEKALLPSLYAAPVRQ